MRGRMRIEIILSRIPTLLGPIWAIGVLLAGCQPEPTTGSSPATTVLTRALGGEPETLDPRLASDNPSLALMLELYEGLTSERPDGVVEPGAAASWRTSPDGKTWTFTLRQGLRWSNGESLTATHFVAGLDAARATGTQAPYGALLDSVLQATATDQRTIVLTLQRPVPYLPALLALPVAAPQYPAGNPASATVVSNGAYRLVARRPGEKIELERNPHYHSSGQVQVERVTYLTLDDLNTELNLYRSGQLDLTSEVPNARIEWIKANLPGELHIAPYLSTYSYAVNLARLPDEDARRALAMAVDRSRITNLVTGAGERPAMGWVAEGVPGYAAPRFQWARLDDARRIAEARAAWQRAQGKHRRIAGLTLCTDSSENHHRTAIALADQWHEALGVEIKLVEMEWKAYLAMRDHPGECDLLRLGWSADFVDPESFLTLFETGDPQNTLGYSNDRYDALLAESRRTANTDKRMKLLAAAEALLLEDLPMIPIFHRVSKRLAKPYVLGMHDNPLGHLASRHLRLDR